MRQRHVASDNYSDTFNGSVTRSTSDEREVDLVDGEIVEVIDARGTWWKIVRWNGEAGSELIRTVTFKYDETLIIGPR